MPLAAGAKCFESEGLACNERFQTLNLLLANANADADFKPGKIATRQS